MEWLLLNGGSSQNLEPYNCSKLAPYAWTEQFGRPNVIIGILSLIYGTTIICLYIPCLIVIKSKDFAFNSCFRLMFFIGVLDLASLTFNSVISGILLIKGAVFCSYPDFIFVCGSMSLGLWGASCMSCLLLSINRILDNISIGQQLVDKIYTYKNTTFMIFLVVLYGSSLAFFTHPPLYTSKHRTWLFDPEIYDGRSSEYSNNVQIINNLIVSTCTTLIYITFIVLFKTRIKPAQQEPISTNTSYRNRRIHIQVFFQSMVSCWMTLLTATTYALMQFVYTPAWVSTLAQTFWQATNGCSVIVYLIFNKTIRNRVIKLLTPIKRNRITIFTLQMKSMSASALNAITFRDVV